MIEATRGVRREVVADVRRPWGIPRLVGLAILGSLILLQHRANAQPASKPAVEVASAGPVAGKASDGAATTGEASGRRSESFLAWMVRASGVIGLLILGMSFYLVAVVVWMFYHFRRSTAVPEATVREVSDLLALKQYDKAFTRIASDQSLLARTLTAGVRKLPSGLPAAQRALELANDDADDGDGAPDDLPGDRRHARADDRAGRDGLRDDPELPGDRDLGRDAAGDPTGRRDLDGACSLTLEGIALSVPAIAFYAFFRNRIARLSLEVQILTEGLLEQFAPGVRAPHPLITATARPPTRTALPPREG